jgi:uncharacterized membrane protein YbhN (UPF0104 family)
VRRRDEGDFRRRPGDAVRLVLAALLVTVLTWHASRLTATERSVADFFHSIPDGARSLLRAGYTLVSLWAVGIVAVAALLLGRWRLARDAAVAGAIAWLLGRLIAYTQDHSTLADALRIVLDRRGTPPFPTVRVAVAVAIITVAGPYLTRPVRYAGQALVAVLALTTMYLGRGLVTDVLAAVALGWGTAAGVRLAFGTPLHRPTARQVTGALRRMRLNATGVRPLGGQPVGRVVMSAQSGVGRIRVYAIGRDEADAQLLARTWRFIAYRDAPSNLLLTRRQQVEYEAYVMLLAAQGGVRVPPVLGTSNGGGVAVLVTDELSGVRLDEVDWSDDERAARVLACLWQRVLALHDVRIAHGWLDAHHLVVSETDDVGLVGWDRATTEARAEQLAVDVAQALAITAPLAGVERAVAAAHSALGSDRLGEALAWLQGPVIGPLTQALLDEHGGEDTLLEALRSNAATACGVEAPELRQLTRVNPRRILMAVGALVGVGVLLSRVGDPVEFWHAIQDATWGYVLLAFVLGVGTDVAFAFAFMGTVPVRVPVWPAIELQSSLSFANLAVPVGADAAMKIRFLQKHGMDVSEAVATGGLLSTISEVLVQLVLFGIAVLLAPDAIDFGEIDTRQAVVIALVIIFVLGIGAALVFAVRKIRDAVIPPLVRAARAAYETVKTPSRIALMLGGNIAAQCLYAASLLACLAAFGHPVSFWTLLALNIGISLIASLVPVPGGGTAVSAIGMTGFLVALGVPSAAATGAVLSHQLAVSYLPAIPGWFASNDLARRGAL